MTRRATIAELYRFAFRCNLDLLRPRVRVASGARPTQRGDIACEVLTTWPDAHDGTPREYATPVHLLVDKPETWRDAIRSAFLDRCAHEFDEALERDGELVCDPHVRSEA